MRWSEHLRETARDAPEGLDCKELMDFLRKRNPNAPFNLTAILPLQRQEGQAQVVGRTFGPREFGAANNWARQKGEEGLNIYHTTNRVYLNAPHLKPRKGNIEFALGIHVEIDPTGGAAEWEAEQARFTGLVEEQENGPTPPTWIVHSGNGVQMGWDLIEPLPMKEKANLELIENINVTLIRRFGGDPGTHNVDRLLRAPGTLNRPDWKKQTQDGRTVQWARLLLWSGRKYTLEELVAAFPPTMARHRNGKADAPGDERFDGSEPEQKVMSELDMVAVDQITGIDDLPDGLWLRFSEALEWSHALQATWHGERNSKDADLSGSGYLAALAAGLQALDAAPPFLVTEFGQLAMACHHTARHKDLQGDMFTRRRALVRAWMNGGQWDAGRRRHEDPAREDADPGVSNGGGANGYTGDEAGKGNARQQPPPGDAGSGERSTEADGPLPLFPLMPPQAPYPIEAFSRTMREATEAIARKIQVPLSLAAQSVLAVTALAHQTHADVRLPHGHVHPLSLDLFTIAVTGDRKSSSDTEALQGLRRMERDCKEVFESKLEAWQIEHAAWEAQKRNIERKTKSTREERENELRKLGRAPERPLSPQMIFNDHTIEGLTKTWPNLQPSLGIFSTEGGVFTSGHSMKEENIRNTAGLYNQLWDGDPVRRLRASDGLTDLEGRRVTIHLLVQPEVASKFLGNPILQGVGFLSRILVSFPQSMRGTRFWRQPLFADEMAIKAFADEIYRVLAKTPQMRKGKRNELAPRVVQITDAATERWGEFYNRVEALCAPGERLHNLYGFAEKAGEQTCRIAALLALSDDSDVAAVGPDTMARAIILMDWYIGEAVRLHTGVYYGNDPDLPLAEELRHYLSNLQGEDANTGVTRLHVMRNGPTKIRLKKHLDKAITILRDHGWLEPSCKGKLKLC